MSQEAPVGGQWQPPHPIDHDEKRGICFLFYHGCELTLQRGGGGNQRVGFLQDQCEKKLGDLVLEDGFSGAASSALGGNGALQRSLADAP